METIKEAAMKANFSEIDIHSNTALACKNAHKLFEMGVSWAERWIPVEDELPPVGENITLLLKSENKQNVVFEVRTFKKIINLKRLRGWFDFYDFTHWRLIEHK